MKIHDQNEHDRVFADTLEEIRQHDPDRLKRALAKAIWLANRLSILKVTGPLYLDRNELIFHCQGDEKLATYAAGLNGLVPVHDRETNSKIYETPGPVGGRDDSTFVPLSDL